MFHRTSGPQMHGRSQGEASAKLTEHRESNKDPNTAPGPESELCSAPTPNCSLRNCLSQKMSLL